MNSLESEESDREAEKALGFRASEDGRMQGTGNPASEACSQSYNSVFMLYINALQYMPDGASTLLKNGPHQTSGLPLQLGMEIADICLIIGSCGCSLKAIHSLR